MEDKKTIIFFKETFLESIVSDAWTFAGILLCIWFAEEKGSVFWLSVSCVGLFVWMIPFKPHQKKFMSREELYKYLTSNDNDSGR